MNMNDDSRLLQPDRFLKIQEFLSTRHTVKVSELSRELNVSENTIRRDLVALEEAGICFRTKGGAGLLQSSVSGATFSRRLSQNRGVKSALARASVALVQSGDTVIIGSGTTAYEIAVKLCEMEHITVITSSLEAAQILTGLPELTLILSGGIVHGPSRSMTGSPAENFFDTVNADILFLSVKGVSIEKGLTDHTIVEASVKQRMITCAKRVVLITDSGKLGQTALGHVCDLAAVDTLITDDAADPAFLDLLRKRGIGIIQVSSKV